MTASAPIIALVAGETSGDQLGAALVEQLRARFPGARFVGVAGRQMQAAGVEAWWDSSELAVMGLVEVLAHRGAGQVEPVREVGDGRGAFFVYVVAGIRNPQHQRKWRDGLATSALYPKGD